MRNKKVMLVVVGIMIFGLLFMVISPMLTPKPKSKSIAPSTKSTNSNSVSSGDVLFTHEGSLWFISSEGDTLSQIDLEIADNDYEIQRGLMDRKSMAENQGMIFIFDNMEPRSFWMKNTFLPLDIIFITDQMAIESIRENTTPYSEQSVPSIGPAQYVVEVNAGYTKLHGIQPGTKIAFDRD